jgi:hypothetical protein
MALWLRAEFPATQVVVASASLIDLQYLLGYAQQIALLAKPYTPLEVTRLFRRMLAARPRNSTPRS